MKKNESFGVLLPLLPANPTPCKARTWVRSVVRAIGPGFHPDTPPAEYVDVRGQRIFDRRQSALLTRDLNRACGVLGHQDFEAVCLTTIWHGLGVRYDATSDKLVSLPASSA